VLLGAATASLRESQISRLPFAVPLKLSCMPGHLISCHHSKNCRPVSWAYFNIL
jgi:hypothetical protein